ncbi:helix-turn-helix transcriptional regulator [Lentzea albidocapillata]|uniref:Regulatory protein, luxR family n=1 Tax=Lentzea albidocapillata TaxID=40571 RepID=A0A1W2FSA4_9PSEU|nr:helix-turn-helix transcriptional regulator [Lentzea albidocapillata]SMD24753.1 regulatory protein, luxR family [Lentzea albidocapillata]
MTSTALVGRDQELAAVRAAYERSRRDRPITVLVFGEAGIGKTRLVAAATESLTGDPLVLTGGCLELGAGGPPYVPFVAILRQLVQDLGTAARDLATEVTTWLTGEQANPQAASRGSLLEKLVHLFGRIAARRPLVLVVEDLHWADVASRELFVYLARNLGSSGVLLVGTVRTGELDLTHPMRQVIGELGRRPDVVEIELGPLTRSQVAEHLCQLGNTAPDPATVAELHVRGGGNPLFVEALWDAGDSAADTLKALLLQRVARLPEPAREVLSVLAVTGSGADDELFGEVAELPDRELESALRVLVDRSQVTVVGDRYVIRHELIREAVYAHQLPARLRRLHARCATVLARRASCDAAELARHWYLAGNRPAALRSALAAATRSRVRFAYDEELRQLARVVELWPLVPDAAECTDTDLASVHEQATFAAMDAGASTAGREHAAAALALLDAGAEPARAALLLAYRGLHENRTDANGLACAAAAVALVPPGVADDVRCRVLVISATLHVMADDPGPAHAHAMEAVELARRQGDDTSWSRGLACLGLFDAWAGDLDAARGRFAEATRLAAAADADADADAAMLQCHSWHCEVLRTAGDYAGAAEVARRGLEHAERVGQVRARGTIQAVNLADALLPLGRWDEVLEIADDALSRRPAPLVAAGLNYMVAMVSTARGDIPAAAQRLDAIESGIESSSDAGPFLLPSRLLRCDLALVEGDPEHADRVLGAILANGPALVAVEYRGFQTALVGARVQRARRAAAPRNRAIATSVRARWMRLRALLDQLEARTPENLACRLTFEATASNRLPDWDAATSAWRALAARYELAQCLTAAGEAALADSNQSGARLRLAEAHDIAATLGAAPLLSRLSDLARRARLTKPEPAPVGNGIGLTARELDVLRVLARGRTNGEIANELFVSVNTVGAHVTRIYTKLSVNSRTEAVAVAHRVGLL